jgi:uncharacterized protein
MRTSDRYIHLLLRYAGRVLWCCLLLFGLSGFLASRLQLRAQISELLPEGDPAVVQFDRLLARVGASTTFNLLLTSDSALKNRALAVVLAKRFAEKPPGTWRSISYETSQERAFFDSYSLLYADLEDLVFVKDTLKRQIDRNKTGASNLFAEDEEPLTQLQARLLAKYQQKFQPRLLFPSGYFEAEESGVQKLVIVLRPATEALGGDETEALYAMIDGIVKDVQASLDDSLQGVEVAYAGDIPSTLQEKKALKEDLGVASIACIILVCLVIWLYFRQLRALFLVVTPALLGTLCSFGIAQIFIGYVNSNSAFLGSIILGNGINYAIIFLARYREERLQGHPLDVALRNTVASTWRPTLASSIGASVAYGSLLITRFRGFNQFGFVGGLGMLLCWSLTFTMLPALISALEQRRPSRLTPRAKHRANIVSRAFAALLRLALRRPRLLLVSSLIVSVLALLPVARIAQDPFEYNFTKLRNKRSLTEGPASHQEEIIRIFGRSLTPALLLADSVEEAQEARQKIIERDDASPRACIGPVEALSDYLPTQQPEKLIVLAELRRLLSDDALSLTDTATQQQLATLNQRLAVFFIDETPTPVRLQDLPVSVAAPYTELDGTRGRLLQLQRGRGVSGWDGKDLSCFAQATSGITLSSGKEVSATGIAQVMNDVINAIVRDGPRAALASLFGVSCLLLLTFRGARGSLTVLFSLVVGVSMMLGIAALFEMRLNFFNFVAIPITFGIASEYGINLYERGQHEPLSSLAEALHGTGGAIALCSLTTIIGYSTLLLSDNQALNSFGMLAGLGELTTLLSAMLVIPAVLRIQKK